MIILQVNNLTQHFGQLAAVKDLSFEVEKGEIFGIAGPNGAGKTTLFNVLTGFYRGSGDVIFDGRSIMGLRPHQICHRGIARTFQIPELFLTLPIVDNVRVGAHFGGRGGRDERERINEAISFVGLQGKENVIAANLNLFDKKLTLLAGTLATRPKLLLLDEPISGLSPTETREYMTLIRRTQKELGLTIIVIEHLMKVLTEISQRLMILHNGEKICIGPPKEVTKDKRVIEIYLGG
jgi:branched-chain amino acid transport system ATP-binding protein